MNAQTEPSPRRRQPSRAQVIGALMAVGRPAILEHYEPASCIVSTRVAIEVLERFGYRAKAAVVEARIYNAIMADAMDAGHPQPATVPGAHSLGLGSPTNDQRGLHVVAICDELLIDLSLDQAARPAKGLPLTASVFVLRDPAAFWRGEPAWFDLPARGAIGYRRRPGAAWHTESPGWGKRDRPLRRQIVRRVLEALHEGGQLAVGLVLPSAPSG